MAIILLTTCALLSTAPAAAAAASSPSSAPAPRAAIALGTEFKPLTLDEALALGQAQHRATVVVFSAKWCDSCQQLSREVFETAHGTFLSQRAQAVQIDFDGADARPLVQRYNIISLPTTLVLRPDGSEIGRVEGYEQRRTYVADASELLDGRDPLPECERKLAAARDDVAALFCVGKAYLDRGREQEALPLLEEVLVRDPRNRHRMTDRALFVMGRYFARVRGLPRAARHYFRELDARFPRTKYGAGAAWWYARSLHKIGKTELGYIYLEQRARRGDADSVAELGAYAALSGVQREEALQQVRRALRRNPRHAELKRLSEQLAAEPTAAP